MTENFYPIIIADSHCPTWTKLSWWDRLLRKKPNRVMLKMPGGVFVCSPETKEHYEKSMPTMIPYAEK